MNVDLDYDMAMRWPVISDQDAMASSRILTASSGEQRSAQLRLEADFARRMKARFALSFMNGTSALYSAVQAMQIPRLSEVLVPALTHWASVLPLCTSGLIPIFCDVDPETLCIDPAEIARKVSPRTRAILVVHLFGQLADMRAIERIAAAHRLAVIEDASQALGATHDDRPAGTCGRAGCFSLQSSKYVPAGEGGVLVTNDRALWHRAQAIGHGDRLLGCGDETLGALHHTGLGFKFRIHPVAAELARLSLARFGPILDRLDRYARNLREATSKYPFLHWPGAVPGARRVYWTRLHLRYVAPYCAGLSRDELRTALARAGVLMFDRATPYGSGLHQQPVFKNGDEWLSRWFPDATDAPQRILDSAGVLPVTEGLEQSDILTLPVFAGATDAFNDAYINRLDETLAWLRAQPASGACS